MEYALNKFISFLKGAGYFLCGASLLIPVYDLCTYANSLAGGNLITVIFGFLRMGIYGLLIAFTFHNGSLISLPVCYILNLVFDAIFHLLASIILINNGILFALLVLFFEYFISVSYSVHGIFSVEIGSNHIGIFLCHYGASYTNFCPWTFFS